MLADHREELRAGVMILFPIEPEDAIARAVIKGRVLKAFLAGHLHFLDIDLHTIAGPFPAKERELPGPAFRGAADRRIPQLPADALDRGRGHPDPMNPLEPNADPSGPILQVTPGVFDKLDSRISDSSASVDWIAGH